MVPEEILQTIHQCVIHSIIRHILKFPTDHLLEYLSKYPPFKRNDILYYLLLKRDGKNAYYNSKGVHILSIQPNLSGVYVLAGENVHASILLNNDKHEQTIYPIITASIDRFIKCPTYKIINDIITEEATFLSARNHPDLYLNIHKYQANHPQIHDYNDVAPLLIDHDCLEPFQNLHFLSLTHIITRMSTLVISAPQLWRYVLSNYYMQQLMRLKIHRYYRQLSYTQIKILGTLFPEIVTVPPNLGGLASKIWFRSINDRAYLLGFNLAVGVPCDAAVSYQLEQLNKYGIESYVNTATTIHVDGSNKLTGFIGFNFYPHIIGKRLRNSRDTLDRLVNSFFPSDLIPVVHEDEVYILTEQEFSVDEDLTHEWIDEYICSQAFPYFDMLNSTEIDRIHAALTLEITCKRSLQMRPALVEFE